jgi:hypothetical protein
MRAMRGIPSLVLCLVLLGAVAGCTSGVQCFEIRADECQRITDAATDAIPPGHTRLYVEEARGRGERRYQVFACYPDDSQVVVQVTLGAGDAHVQPLEGVELASCD